MSQDSATVYYAIDRSPLHRYLALQSIRSLRSRNRRIPVEVCLFGESSGAARREFAKVGARVIALPAAPKGPRELPATFLKWRALKHVKASRVLFADADTWFFEDPMKLLRAYRERNFYAREEYGTRAGIGYQLLGNMVLEPQIHAGKFAALSALLGFKPVPVFNTGVMIFNHGFARTMAGKIREMERVYRVFLDKPAYFPAERLHIVDEVVASVIFGMEERPSVGRISRAHSPWYCEWKAGVVRGKGIVMHSWTKYSPFFLRDFAGDKAARKLPFLIPVEERYAEK